MDSLLDTKKHIPPHDVVEHGIVGSVSKVEMVTPMALIYKVLFPSISTFETPPIFPYSDYTLMLLPSLMLFLFAWGHGVWRIDPPHTWWVASVGAVVAPWHGGPGAPIRV